MLLNSPLAVDAARAFAKRVAQEAGDDPARQVHRAFALALQRPPGEAELTACRQLVSDHSLAKLCRVLVNLNEFAYVE